MKEIGQNQSEFAKLIDKIKENQDYSFKCKVNSEIENKSLKIKYMTLSVDGLICNQFIRAIDEVNLENSEISFKISSLKLKILQGIQYFYIENYKSIININANIFYSFKEMKIYDSINHIDNNNLCSIKLIVQEGFDTYIKNKYIFKDISGNIVNIKGLNNYNFQNKKIYVFSGFIYNKLLNQLESTFISSIEECSINTEKILSIKEMSPLKIGNILSIKAKVKYFNISENYAIIGDQLGNNYKLILNFNLLKKINLNNDCIFLNCIKMSDKTLHFSSLSDIILEDETYIEFNFVDYYQNDNLFYNRITINNNNYEINNSKVKIKINDKGKKNVFIQNISLTKFQEGKNKESLHFSLEINKGKNNHINSSCNKGGFCYQFLIKTLKKEDLPNKIPITINNNIKYLTNPDKFNNELEERFSIVNIPKQNVKNIFNLSKEDYIDDKINDRKYLILIKNKNNMKIYKKSINPKQKKFLIPKEIEENIKNIFEKYIINESELKKRYNNQSVLFPDIDTNNNKKIPEIIKEFLNGFNEYEFDNTKENYENVKYISFIILHRFSYKASLHFETFKSNYKVLLESIINLNYIDRIKILISFILSYYRNIFEKDIVKDSDGKIIKTKEIGPTYDYLNLADLDKPDSIKDFPFIKNAFDIFYDGLKEDCPLFQIIQRLNSLIYKEISSDEFMYSGSLLSLNDIKLELIQNINRFFLLSIKKNSDLESFAYFEDNGLSIIINIISFFENINYIKKNRYIKNATLVTLFLLFHECLGHQKKNINNQQIDTPRTHYRNILEDIQSDVTDARFIFELLFGEIVNLNIFMEIKNAEKFLNKELYLAKDFKELRKIYFSIHKDLNGKEEKNDDNIKDEKDSIINIDEKKVNEKGYFINKRQNNSKIEQIKELPKKRHLLFRDLLLIYGNMPQEEKEKNKNDEQYQRFLDIYNKRLERKKYYKENLKFITDFDCY